MQLPLRFCTARTTCAEEHAPATDDLRTPCGAWAQSVCIACGTLACKPVPSLTQAAATARPRAVATSQAAGCADMPREGSRPSQHAPTAVSCPHLCQARPSCLRVSPMPVEAEPADAANAQTSSAAVEATSQILMRGSAAVCQLASQQASPRVVSTCCHGEWHT